MVDYMKSPARAQDNEDQRQGNVHGHISEQSFNPMLVPELLQLGKQTDAFNHCGQASNVGPNSLA